MDEEINLVIAGSIGIDTIETPNEKKESILGGSASYACAAASFFSKPDWNRWNRFTTNS